jgi:hypothetical protein
MQMKLIEKNSEDWTQFKISVKELNSIPALIIKAYGYEPIKVSSRYTYYEIKGDFLNGKFGK